MRRKRAMSILELLISVALLVGLFAILGSGLRLAVGWSTSSGQEISAARRADILRMRLMNAVLAAQPVVDLSLLTNGQILETTVAGAARTWGG